MASPACNCPSCLVVVANSSSAIMGDRFVAMFERLPEFGKGFESFEISAQSISEAVAAVRQVIFSRQGLSLEGTLVKLERVDGQPCKRVWTGKLKFEWRQVDLAAGSWHRPGSPDAIGTV